MECVQGAEVTLLRAANPVATTTTDGFGDFRFDNLPKGGGAYRVDVSHALGGAGLTVSWAKASISAN